MPQIRPITDLRKTNEISELCHAKKEPVFITKNGYGDLVVMSIETYEAMLGAAEADAAITKKKAADEDGGDGQPYDNGNILMPVRRKDMDKKHNG